MVKNEEPTIHEAAADETKPLQAWTNHYEVVAARSEQEAREVVRKMGAYDEEELDGDGWKVIPNDTPLHEEDGTLSGETVAMMLVDVTEPGPLWSCEL